MKKIMVLLLAEFFLVAAGLEYPYVRIKPQQGEFSRHTNTVLQQHLPKNVIRSLNTMSNDGWEIFIRRAASKEKFFTLKFTKGENSLKMRTITAKTDDGKTNEVYVIPENFD